MIDEQKIREMVRRAVLRTVQAASGAPGVEPERRRLVTLGDLEAAPPGSRFELEAGAILTPLARQAALERRISVVGAPTSSAASRAVPRAETDGARTVAVAADHGGYELKERLAAHLREGGFTVLDCGTDGRDSVDYPDFALAAARLVARGTARAAVVVDGAGIGSCMAANKVPGVRAAMCYDEASAVNSREHNHANVLTLGAGMIGPALAVRILDAWLDTPHAGGRHARRVEKIMDIERRYSKG
jgi:ribose 5-phosphate isomerase B